MPKSCQISTANDVNKGGYFRPRPVGVNKFNKLLKVQKGGELQYNEFMYISHFAPYGLDNSLGFLLVA